MGDINEEHGERFHQDISTKEDIKGNGTVARWVTVCEG